MIAISSLVISSICAVTSDIIIKKNSMGNLDILFLRYLFGVIFLIPFADFRKIFTKNNFIRAILISLAMSFFFYGLKLLPLANVIVITFSTSIWVTMLASIVLKENIKNRIFPICTGLTGIIIALFHNFETHSNTLATLSLLVAAFFFACVEVFNKYNIEKDEIADILAGTYLFGALFLLPLNSFQMPSASNFTICIASGLLSNLIFLFLLIAAKRADVSSFQTIKYIEFPISVWASYALFNQPTSFNTYLGFAVLFSSIVISIFTELRNYKRYQ
jgi:S-adenosylmethionine uptake transporter